MRTKTVLTTLLVAAMLVVGCDYVSFAATGRSFLLGTTNSTSKITTLSRTAKGAALSLKVKPGYPPLAVSSDTKVARLNADRLDGLDATDLQTRVTAFQPDICHSVDNLPIEAPTKISDLGTFTKKRASSFVRLDLSTHVQVSGPAAETQAVKYELRVDGKATPLGNATVLVMTFGTDLPVDLAGVFPDLAAGTHTVSLWVTSFGGGVGRAASDPGCWNSFGVNDVIVTELA